jgi:3-hydroxyacyl-[acyl-carrier-protein] dehydratase
MLLGWTSKTEDGSFMRFQLIDRIHQYETGKTLKASKNLTLGEEYLADHFPTFPVMPGVMMLQAATEASAWLWRISSNFQHAVIVLREVKNVKYGTFMQPGFTLELASELIKHEGEQATFRVKGNVAGGGQTINAQITLLAYNLASKMANGQATDTALIGAARERWAWLTGQYQAKSS